jgi:hypothetical protein
MMGGSLLHAEDEDAREAVRTDTPDQVHSGKPFTLHGKVVTMTTRACYGDRCDSPRRHRAH